MFRVFRFPNIDGSRSAGPWPARQARSSRNARRTTENAFPLPTLPADATQPRTESRDNDDVSTLDTLFGLSFDSSGQAQTDVRRVVVLPSDEMTPHVPGITEQPIRIFVESGDTTRLVRIAGELDTASGDLVLRSCTHGRTADVVVDLTDLTFMDCGGYGSLVAARLRLEGLGRTLVIVGAVGEPRRLLDLIDQLGPSR